MNTKVLRNTTNSSRFVQDLTRRKLQERKYLDVVTWELNMSNAKIRFLFVQERTEGIREDMIKGNFYSACIYDILNDRRRPRQETPTLNHLKTKIARLHSKQFQYIFTDKHEGTLFQGEMPSLSHLLQLRKRRVSQMKTSVVDKDGVTQMTTWGIVHAFVNFLQSKYDPIQMDDEFVNRMEKAGHRILPPGWTDFLDTPITEEELKAAVNNGTCNKAPERDGIYLDFFKVNWDSIRDDMQAIFNRIFLDGRIMEQ